MALHCDVKQLMTNIFFLIPLLVLPPIHKKCLPLHARGKSKLLILPTYQSSTRSSCNPMRSRNRTFLWIGGSIKRHISALSLGISMCLHILIF